MNQNFYNSNSSGFDQSQPPQFPVIHQPPQKTSIKILHDQENEIDYVQTFLRKFNRYSFFKMPKVLFLAWDKVFKIKDALGNKQYKPEDIQELLRELFNDVKNIHEELAEYINTPGWNRPALCNNGDDDDEDCTIAVTPDFSITDSLIMENEHLDTILETESDEFIKSSVENLVPIPSDDDESSHEEVIHEMSFKTYSNPLFDLDEEIISIEFNSIHNEDLNSTPKNDRFDTKCYLLESLLNRDESIPPGIDNDDSDSEGDTLSLERLLHDDPIPLSDTLHFSIDVRVFSSLLHLSDDFFNSSLLWDIPGNLKTLAKGFCIQVFISSASIGNHVIEDITTIDIEEIVSTAALITTTVTNDELTMAQALVEIKKSKPKGATTTTTDTIPTPDSTRPKARGVVMQEPNETPTTTTILKSSKVQDKGNDKLAKEKAQLIKDENLAWDNVHAIMDADYELAARREEKKTTNQSLKEESNVCLSEKQAGFTHSQLKNKSFNKVQKAFDKTMSLINLFVPMYSVVVKDKSVLTQEGSSKRAGEELEQESVKTQRIKEENESVKLKRCLEIVPDDGDDVTIDAIPLSTKYLTIVDYKIYKEWRKSYFQFIRADGNSLMYLTFKKMLKNFNREDLKVLWSIVKARFEKIKPLNYMDNLLFRCLKTMFEHHVEDTMWRNQQGLAKVLNWKLFDSCGVYCVTMQNAMYFLLVEKMYPLTKNTLHQMWNDVRHKLIMNVRWHMIFLYCSGNRLWKAMYHNKVFG
uniref:Uncharacterized protein n=1 Tax=Tanacetum cinerariifolium TaxID=118510 RepID=A0A6L2J8X0_TANCI|nr:hypothetical protein [Tanacetum cinerariifolium]